MEGFLIRRIYPPRGALALRKILSQSAIGQRDRVFHTVWDGIDAGDLRFRPQVVGVVKVVKDFSCGDGKLYSQRCAGSMYDPQLISDRPVGLGFPRRAGRF